MKINHNQHPSYRADIDGLRAVAVLSVVGFHAFPSWVKGGYIGVDVFFVISGFLISTIIMGSLERDDFSYMDFYERRIRRIFPALMLMMGGCLLLGWFVLLADEYRQLGKHAMGGTTFISNLLLWGEAGYFDTTAETKPLLHLWSLAIEEQFYIFWPLLLGVVWRQKFNFLTITLVMAGLSFVLNMALVQSDLVAAFYSPLSRFWELMVGGVLAYLVLHRPEVLDRHANAQSAVGFALLALGLVTISKDTAFPGWRALLPAVGAFLLISAGSGAWFNRHVLASKPLVWFGLISYPLYLWHWPALTFAHILNGSRPNAAVRVGAIAFSVVAAYLTYRLIETRFRRPPHSQAKSLGMVAVALVTLVAGVLIYWSDGVPDRAITARIADKAGLIVIHQPRIPAGVRSCVDRTVIDAALQPHCRQYEVKVGAPSVVIWGDSSSDAWGYVFYKLAEQHGFNVVLISHPSCPPLLGVRKSFHRYSESHKYCSDARLGDTVMSSLTALKPQAVVLIGAWNTYGHFQDAHASTNEYITIELDAEANAASSIAAIRQQLPLTIKALDRLTNVLVFESWPTLLALPNYPIDRLPFVRLNASMPLKAGTQHQRESALVHEVLVNEVRSGRTSRTKIYDPAVRVCGTVCEMALDNVGLYKDQYHITAHGSFLFADDVWTKLGPMLASANQ